MKYPHHLLLLPSVVAAFSLLTTSALGQGTAFSYQGRLIDNGQPANGDYGMVFYLCDNPTVDGQLGNVEVVSVPVSNGLFTVTLDFGAGMFPGAERWLEIAVKTNGAATFTTLNPRQKLTSTPYAITASSLSGTLPASQLSGTVPLSQLPDAVVTNNQSGVTFSGTFSGSGGGLTSGDWLTRRKSMASDDDWSMNFKAWTNEYPALSIYQQGADSLRFSAQFGFSEIVTNNAAITNGALRINPTNEIIYYWHRAASLPVQSVRMRIRIATNGAVAGGTDVDDLYILVARAPQFTTNPLQIPGQTNWFFHFKISRYTCGADIYTNGLNGLVASSAISKDVPVIYRMKDNDVMDVGFDVLANGKGDTIRFVFGSYVQYWHSDYLTNLFAPMTGFGTNITYEIIRQHPLASSLEIESMSYSTSSQEAWPLGIFPNVNAQGLPDIGAASVTINSNTAPIIPAIRQMTLWNSNGFNLWVLKNQSGTITTNLIQ